MTLLGEPGTAINAWWLLSVVITGVFAALRSARATGARPSPWDSCTLRAPPVRVLPQRRPRQSRLPLRAPVALLCVRTARATREAVEGDPRRGAPGCTAQALSYVYYTFFSCVLLAAAGALGWLRTRRLATSCRGGRSPHRCSAPPRASSPASSTGSTGGTPSCTTRRPGLGTLGLKIRHLLVPIAEHPLPPLRALRGRRPRPASPVTTRTPSPDWGRWAPSASWMLLLRGGRAAGLARGDMTRTRRRGGAHPRGPARVPGGWHRIALQRAGFSRHSRLQPHRGVHRVLLALRGGSRLGAWRWGARPDPRPARARRGRAAALVRRDRPGQHQGAAPLLRAGARQFEEDRAFVRASSDACPRERWCSNYPTPPCLSTAPPAPGAVRPWPSVPPLPLAPVELGGGRRPKRDWQAAVRTSLPRPRPGWPPPASPASGSTAWASPRPSLPRRVRSPGVGGVRYVGEPPETSQDGRYLFLGLEGYAPPRRRARSRGLRAGGERRLRPPRPDIARASGRGRRPTAGGARATRGRFVMNQMAREREVTLTARLPVGTRPPTRPRAPRREAVETRPAVHRRVMVIAEAAATAGAPCFPRASGCSSILLRTPATRPRPASARRLPGRRHRSRAGDPAPDEEGVDEGE